MTITIDTMVTTSQEEEWLKLRTQDITSSDCAALFGLSPYASYWELWQAKANPTATEMQKTEYLKWGNRLQDPIAYGLAEDYGLIIIPLNSYLRLLGDRIGSSFDYLIVGVLPTSPYYDLFQEKGEGLLEIKNVDRMMHKKNWAKDEATPQIEMQVQHQMLVSQKEWCLIGGLIGGNTSHIILRMRDPEIGDAIIEKAREFWHSIDTNTPPKPDLYKDAQAVIDLYSKTTADSTVDASGNSYLQSLANQYHETKEKIKNLEKELLALKANIFVEMGDIETAYGADWRIMTKIIKGTPDTVITASMVGQIKKGRSDYRQCLVDKKE